MVPKLVSRFQLVEEESPEGYREFHYKDRPLNLSVLLDETAARWPDEIAFVDGDRRITYREFLNCVNRISAGLQKKWGIQKGDRVALLLGIGLPFCLAYFGAVRLGAIVVPLNTRYKGEELVYEINDSGAKVLIADRPFYETLAPVQDRMKAVSSVFINDGAPPSGTLSFDILTSYESDDFDPPHVSEWDILNILYTSGTTGKPKGAMQTHRGIIGTAMMTHEFLNYQHGRDKVLCVIPLFHTTGLSMNLLASVYGGVPVVFMNKFHPEEALKLIQKERITRMVAVIAVYWLMLNHQNFDQYDLSSLREILYGGSPAAEDVIREMRQKLPGVILHNGYGLTETHAYDTHLPDEDAISHVESVGKILPLVEMKVVDFRGNELSPGQIGELLIKGCKVVRGYWNRPEENRESFTHGWLHTGDAARIDENGYVYIMDRFKDMINRGGEKIYSIEVENALYAYPKILEAAVYGIPDEVFGEQVKAAVVVKPRASATTEEIREFCARRLADYKVPIEILFLDELPRNPAGKVVKGKLRERG
ncbi:MAG: acyl--CoA ligase [Deltaproteobacteria bacterium]|nr:acyl--CoA ligase [Deltaproteobacteria bacterium]